MSMTWRCLSRAKIENMSRRLSSTSSASPLLCSMIDTRLTSYGTKTSRSTLETSTPATPTLWSCSRHGTYAAKAWPNHERQHALARHLKGQTGRILPVRIDDSEIPGVPSTVGYLDARAVSPVKLAELIRQKVDAR